MSSVTFRPDYAKLLFELPRGLFSTYYTRFCSESHNHKYHGDFLKSHKVVALPNNNPEMETTILEVWGEWAGLVTAMPFRTWAGLLRRFDARAIVWDASEEAVLAVGQRLQRSDVGYNVEVFNSKPASKRLGRDRGGKGFRLGSRKSDMCVVVYKRTGEPAAQEYRLQSTLLRRQVTRVMTTMRREGDVVDEWRQFIGLCEKEGQRRLALVLERAGIGTYWPVYAQQGREDYDQLQTSFAPHYEPTKDDLIEMDLTLHSRRSDAPEDATE